jgi:hypothetical protein
MKKICIILVLILSSNANSELLIEPFLGYAFGSTDQTLSNKGALNGHYKFTTKGYDLGARIGFQKFGFMVGLEGEIGKETENPDIFPVANAANKEDYSVTKVGIFAGFNFPILLRLWATYYLQVEKEITKGESKGNQFEGDGISFGVGYTGFPFISLNAEFRSYTFDEESLDGLHFDLPNSTFSINKQKSILLSISVPLDF